MNLLKKSARATFPISKCFWKSPTKIVLKTVKRYVSDVIPIPILTAFGYGKKIAITGAIKKISAERRRKVKILESIIDSSSLGSEISCVVII